jgi:hypothetical protein
MALLQPIGERQSSEAALVARWPMLQHRWLTASPLKAQQAQQIYQPSQLIVYDHGLTWNVQVSLDGGQP